MNHEKNLGMIRLHLDERKFLKKALNGLKTI